MIRFGFSIPRWVGVILLIGFFIRILNSTFGSPALYVVPDEVLNYLAAFEMISQKTLMTSSQYPPFGAYVQLPFLLLSYLTMLLTGQINSVNDFLLFLTTHEGFFLFIPRIISAIFGTASVFVIYQLARLIFPKRQGIAFWAILLSGFSITHLQISSLGKPNVPALFFYCLGIYFLIKSVLRQKAPLKLQILSLFFFSVGGGFHFSSFFGIVLFFLTIIFFYAKKPFLQKKNLVIIGLVVIPLSFLLVYSVLSTGKYQPTFAETLDVLKYNLTWGFEQVSFFYLKELVRTEPVLTLLMGLSILYIGKWPKIFFPLTIFSLLFAGYIIVSFYHSLRYFLPVFVIWTLVAAFALDNFLKKIKIGKQVILAGILLTLVLPVMFWIYRYQTVPTFMLAKTWIEQNIPPQTLLAATAIRFSVFVPDKSTISLIHEYNPNLYNKAFTYLPQLDRIENTRSIVYLDQIINVRDLDQIMNFLAKYQIQYLIQPYWDPQEQILIRRPQSFCLVRRFSPLSQKPQRVVKNVLHGSGDITELLRIERFGPYIDILEVKL